MNFSVTILGSNAAVPVRGKFPSSQFINIDNMCYLVDCGEGTQFQMLRYDIPKHKINQIFISHLHGDHVFGLIGLITSYHLAGRLSKLDIYSPGGLEQMIRVQLDWSGKAELSYQLEFHIIDTATHQLIFEDKSVSVYSIPLIHRVPTSGYLFIEKQRPPKINKEAVTDYSLSPQQIRDLKAYKSIILLNGQQLEPEQVIVCEYKKRSYAYCSDTAYHPDICQYIKGFDLLYHEATFLSIDNEQAIKAMHSTAKDAAEIAKTAGVGKLIIGHFSARYKDHNVLLNESRQVFPETEIAEEGIVFSL